MSATLPGMAITGKQYVIRSPKQLAALSSAARQELIDALATIGTVSVAEIASTLGRPADALYFHLRALKKAGLVQQVGYRTRSGRKEALYKTIAPELRLPYEPRTESHRRAVTSIVSSMLRLGIRDFGSAFQEAGVNLSGPSRELWALRRTARLSLEEVASLNRSIKGLMNSVAKPSGKGRLYGITILLTPLDHRGREPKQSAKQAGGKKK